MRFTTKAVHGGSSGDPQTGAVNFPIYQTATYSQSSPGHPNEFEGRMLNYGRGENPTRTALERLIASLEDAKYGLDFSSGLAAVAAVLNTLKSGDHVVACSDLYGGCYRMFTKVYAKLGIDFTFVDTTCLQHLRDAMTDATALVWLESPSNPLINITDIEGACKIAKEKNAKVLVDNTFATPYLQQPLSMGADVVLHSTTKFLNGHADVINGAIATNDQSIYENLKFVQNACGFVAGPQDCYLVMRGIKTLSVRMERQCANARHLADWLSAHEKVARVYYPGLSTHPGHELAKRQMKDSGAMLSFELKGGETSARAFLEKVTVFTLAESLGSVQSLICHPPSMTHASVEREVRLQVGIADGLIRASVGIEDIEDLVDDLTQALKAV
jgi:cystathionine beta-lyase/cystathionine gamma-synthase